MAVNSKFHQKLQEAQPCIGTIISYSDPTISETLCHTFDFLWIDMEHSPLTLKDVQGHVMATKGTATLPLVRVPGLLPDTIKGVLDLGAAAVIVPMIRNLEEAKLAVSACYYPPEGIRGYFPRRASDYGRSGGRDLCRQANDEVLCFIQIEHKGAVDALDQILTIPELDGIALGPMDLSASLGYPANPGHPEVVDTVKKVIQKGRDAGSIVGIAVANDPEQAAQWFEAGAHWVSIGCDYMFLNEASTRSTQAILKQLS